jgi:hypothetical protein
VHKKGTKEIFSLVVNHENHTKGTLASNPHPAHRSIMFASPKDCVPIFSKEAILKPRETLQAALDRKNNRVNKKLDAADRKLQWSLKFRNLDPTIKQREDIFNPSFD